MNRRLAGLCCLLFAVPPSTALAADLITATPGNLTFSQQLIATVSISQSVLVTNAGRKGLSIGAATSGDFAIVSNSCLTTLAAGADCSIGVAFTPTAAGLRAGSLTVRGGTSTAGIALNGTGSAIRLTPDPVNFGTVAEFTSNSEAVFISNVSSAPVTISGSSFTGLNASDFGISGPSCNGILPAGDTCTMTLLFTPAGMGSRTGVFTASDNGGGPHSATLVGSGGNPIPSITSTAPKAVYVGTPGVTLTINGTGFIPSSQVSFNNSLRTTQYVSSSQIKVAMLSADLASSNIGFLTVTNPAPGGGFAFFNKFAIVNPVPVLSQVLPQTIVAGSGGFALRVYGNSFMDGAVVRWNGSARPTTYLDSSDLQVQIAITDLIRPSFVNVVVANPTSIGGISAPATFNVSFPATIKVINVPANDLVWDPYARQIYASVPSSAGVSGNSIKVINPFTGTVLSSHFAGSEPTKLALSDDGQFLYVGLNGAGSVLRLHLPSFAHDLNVPLGASFFGGVNTAFDMKTVPLNPHTIAVTVGASFFSNGLEFFTDATELPNIVTSPAPSFIQFADANTLYGSAGSTVVQVAVDSNGGSVIGQFNALSCGFGIHYAAGLLYSDGGQVVDPQTQSIIGNYALGCNNNNTTGNLVPKPAINRTFVAGIPPFTFSSSTMLTSYNLRHFTPIGAVNVANVTGGPTNLTPWGLNGVAFINHNASSSGTSQIVLVQSPMILPPSASPNPVPLPVSVTPSSAVHGGGNLRLSITGSGFVPGSTVTWNGSQVSVDFVNSTTLLVYVPASDLTNAGLRSLTVTNPAPGGGISSPLIFTIN